MIKPSEDLQRCFGVSAVLLSFGAMWGMISGATVRGRMAGAVFSINDSVEAVDSAVDLVEDAVDAIAPHPDVPKSKINQAKSKLRKARKIEEEAQQNISEDMTEMYEEDI